MVIVCWHWNFKCLVCQNNVIVYKIRTISSACVVIVEMQFCFEICDIHSRTSV